MNVRPDSKIDFEMRKTVILNKIVTVIFFEQIITVNTPVGGATGDLD